MATSKPDNKGVLPVFAQPIMKIWNMKFSVRLGADSAAAQFESASRTQREQNSGPGSKTTRAPQPGGSGWKLYSPLLPFYCGVAWDFAALPPAWIAANGSLTL